MQRRLLFTGILILLFLILTITACENSNQEQDIVLPTLYIPATWTFTPSPPPSPSQTPVITSTPSPTFSPVYTDTITVTATPIPSSTPPLMMLQVISNVGANVRSGPGIDYEVIAEVAPGDTLEALAYTLNEQNETWYIINLPDNQQGWIAHVVARPELPDVSIALAATIPPTPSPLPTTTITPLPQGANALVNNTEGLNLRTGPGYSYDILQVLENGDPMVIIGRTDDLAWYEVVVFDGENRLGWVLAELVTTMMPPENFNITWSGIIGGSDSTAFSASSSGRVNGLQCGMNINPREAFGWPDIPTDFSRIRWVRFVFTASPYHFASLNQAFQYFDPIIDAYNSRGIRVLLVLTHETYGESTAWDWNTMTFQDWQTFSNKFSQTVSEVARHYGNKVAAYEIWNEGDVRPGNKAAVAIPPTAYAYLLDRTARAIRSYSSRAYVVLGGLLTSNGSYLRQVKNALGGHFPVDAIAIHPYGLGAPGDETVFSRFGDVDYFINTYNTIAPGMPLWITEFGATGDNSPTRAQEVALYMQNIYEHILNNQNQRVDVIIWYAWSDSMHESFKVNGLVNAQHQPRSPIYETFFNLCNQ